MLNLVLYVVINHQFLSDLDMRVTSVDFGHVSSNLPLKEQPKNAKVLIKSLWYTYTIF